MITIFSKEKPALSLSTGASIAPLQCHFTGLVSSAGRAGFRARTFAGNGIIFGDACTAAAFNHLCCFDDLHHDTLGSDRRVLHLHSSRSRSFRISCTEVCMNVSHDSFGTFFFFGTLALNPEVGRRMGVWGIDASDFYRVGQEGGRGIYGLRDFCKVPTISFPTKFVYEALTEFMKISEKGQTSKDGACSKHVLAATTAWSRCFTCYIVG